VKKNAKEKEEEVGQQVGLHLTAEPLWLPVILMMCYNCGSGEDGQTEACPECGKRRWY
jgi:hypothetical protein